MFKMGPPRYPFDYVYYSTCFPIDGDCLSTLFPNLMVAEICDKFRVKVDDEDIVTLVKKINPLKGLIYERDNEDESIFQYCDQLEMVSVYCVKPYMEKNGVWIKQLKLCNYNLNSLAKVGHYFPNLERLCINVLKIRELASWIIKVTFEYFFVNIF
ncbi:uncharacterized protein LOC107371783 [Tetranychus urticae]|uniref:uncharacterized protein LOC107371783 n=1 Tax=Tetranychus urticae TaxID=32264 RepID=UPI00077B851A|nr:uncharacterized protein LOC107371783 [Tetranychus urticae]